MALTTAGMFGNNDEFRRIAEQMRSAIEPYRQMQKQVAVLNKAYATPMLEMQKTIQALNQSVFEPYRRMQEAIRSISQEISAPLRAYQSAIKSLSASISPILNAHTIAQQSITKQLADAMAPSRTFQKQISDVLSQISSTRSQVFSQAMRSLAEQLQDYDPDVQETDDGIIIDGDTFTQADIEQSLIQQEILSNPNSWKALPNQTKWILLQILLPLILGILGNCISNQIQSAGQQQAIETLTSEVINLREELQSWRKVKVREFLIPREERYKANDPAISGMPRIEKIDFSGNIVVSQKPSKTNMIVIHPGDFVISGINVAKGAMAVYQGNEPVKATIHYSSYTVNEEVIELEYLKRFLKSPVFVQLLKEQVPGGIKTEIKPKHLLPLIIDLPELPEQEAILSRFLNTEEEYHELTREIKQQKVLLQKYRQAVLQEAIEGKLTADWREENPDVEPASDLLARIATEKAELVKQKKIRKQKPLPEISEDDVPFDIPNTWQWCRLGEYALFERGKFTVRPRNDPSCFGGQYPFIQIGSLDSSGATVSSYTQTLNKKGLSASKLFPKGTIMVAIVGGTIGNLGVLGMDMCFPDSIVGVKPAKHTYQDYILTLLRHNQATIQTLAYQMAGQPNIKLPTLTELICALPPIAEQKEIVRRVEAKLALCDALDAEIQQAEQHAQTLSSAVLREVFDHTEDHE